MCEPLQQIGCHQLSMCMEATHASHLAKQENGQDMPTSATCVPQCDLPPSVQAALDCKAWELAAHAHKIIHKHSISVDISCAIGHPVRFIHETDALATIAKTTLYSAFTTSGTSLDAILRYAESTAEVAKEYAERIKLGVQALRGKALLGPVLKAGKMAALA
jgi:hypothetical protein